MFCIRFFLSLCMPISESSAESVSDIRQDISWQTVFNTFGALSIASGLFGMPYAVALRIGANLFGSIYTVLCNKLFDKAHAYFHSTDLKTTLS